MLETIYFSVNPVRKSQYKISAGALSEIIIDKDEDEFEAVANLISDVCETATNADKNDWRSLFRVPANSLTRKARLYAIPTHILNDGVTGPKLRQYSIEVTGLN